MKHILFLGCLLALFALVHGKDKAFSLEDGLLNESTDVWYESLSEDELASHWSEDDGRTLSEKIQTLQALEASVFVDVKLVGFNSDGFMKLKLTPAELLKYFSYSELGDNGEAGPYIINTEVGETSHRDGKTKPSHSLPFKTRYLFRVTAASKTLTKEISAAIQAQVNHVSKDHVIYTNSELPSLLIPYTSVDDIIKQDFNKLSIPSYTIYLLNTNPPTHPLTGNGLPGSGSRVGYKYSQTSSQSYQQRGPECGVMSWVGQDRYAWIDLSAGPVTYGPQTSGGGIMTEHTFPRIDSLFLRDGSSIRRSPNFNSKKHQLMAELAASVRRTSDLLVLPPMFRAPINYVRKIWINLVIIHDQNEPPSKERELAQTKAWEEVADELKRLNLKGQSIEVVPYHIQFKDCELCVTAYTHSLKSHTSNILTDGLRTQVHSYLDSTELHDWLEHFDNSFWGIKAASIRDARSDASDDTSVRVVTAFVYDLDTPDILLYDRFHQSVSFKDIVIGVQTRAPAAVIDYSCNGESMHFDPRDASRSILGSILQTMWGVTPSHQLWSPHMNETETDFMWAIGDSPFAYFSQSKRLSFAIRDAAVRHVLWTDMNHTMSELSGIFTHFRKYEKEIDQVLSPPQHLNFIRRWNLFSFKIKQSQHYISLNNFNQSLFYIRSAHHDLAGLHNLIYAAVAQLKPVLKCGQIESTWSWLVPLSEGVSLFFLVLCVIFFTSRRGQHYARKRLSSAPIFKNCFKRKKF